MGIELLVYIFVYLCICVGFFDVAYLLRSRYAARVLPRRRDRFLAAAQSALNAIADNGTPDPQLRKKRIRVLSRPAQFIAFMEALQVLRERDVLLPEAYQIRLLSVFCDLCPYYRKKPSEYRAYFSYQTARLRFGDIKEPTAETRALQSRLADTLLGFLDSSSVYERENACKAILSLGSCRDALSAVNRLAQMPAHINSKLLSDQLLRFAGDQQALSRALLARFAGYPVRVALSVIDYLRLLPRDAAEQTPYFSVLCGLLADANANKELRLAAIRYFRKYCYVPAFPLLIGFVAHANTQSWEYAAVAASSLIAYPCAETRGVLEDAVASPNWYVRFNAAESLISLGADLDKIAAGHTDAYAHTMLAYRDQVNRLEKEGRVGTSWN